MMNLTPTTWEIIITFQAPLQGDLYPLLFLLTSLADSWLLQGAGELFV